MRKALIAAGIFEMLGALALGAHVAGTMKSGIAMYSCFEAEPALYMVGMMSALGAAAIWLLVASVSGLPVSATHSIVGGIVGMAVTLKGFGCVNWGFGGVAKIAISWVTSPLLACAAAFLVYTVIVRVIYHSNVSFQRALWSTPPLMAGAIMFIEMLVFWDRIALWWAKLLLFGGTFTVIALLMVFFGIPFLKKRISNAYLRTATAESENIISQNTLIQSIYSSIYNFVEGRPDDSNQVPLDDIESSTGVANQSSSSVYGANQSTPSNQLKGRSSDHQAQQTSSTPSSASGGRSRSDSVASNSSDASASSTTALTSGNKKDGSSSSSHKASFNTHNGSSDNSYLAPPPPAHHHRKKRRITHIPGSMDNNNNNTDGSQHLHGIGIGPGSSSIGDEDDDLDDYNNDDDDDDAEHWNAASGADHEEEEVPMEGQEGLVNLATESVRDGEVSEDEMKATQVYWYLQNVTACIGSFAHGANDTANTIGPFAAIWHLWRDGTFDPSEAVPLWIVAIGGVSIVLGLAILGYRVIRTMGQEIIRIDYPSGFASELSSAMTVVVASRLQIPVSSTHCQVGAIIGVGLVSNTPSNSTDIHVTPLAESPLSPNSSQSHPKDRAVDEDTDSNDGLPSQSTLKRDHKEDTSSSNVPSISSPTSLPPETRLQRIWRSIKTRAAQVSWKSVGKIFISWMVTLPVSAGISALLAIILKQFIKS